MVFESIATDLINRFLGDYVENLDKNQLKIGIWGGDVVLNNLALRQNALDDLDLPVQIVYGHLGKLVLKIPWKNLYSEPVVAQIEDLYVLVSPNQSVQFDEEKEEKYDLQGKQSELQKIDDARKLELEKNKPKADKSFSEKLTAQIVNNLQIKISNVHIRYEDKTTAEQPFSLGITLHGLDFYTTDANWTKSYMTEQITKVFKVAKLDSLSAYMNCQTSLFTKCDVSEFPQLFKETIGIGDCLPRNFSYIVAPITSMAKLQLNMNPEYDDPPFVIPKVDLVLEMQKLNVGITRIQFQDVLKLGDSMNRMKLGESYRKYRPFSISYRGHYKEWWHFAMNCVLETNVRKRRREWSWEHMREHRKLIRTYAESYKEKVLSKKPSATLIETCNICEKKLDLFNLILIRNRVHLEVDMLKKEEELKAQTQKSSWFSWWGGSKQDDNNENKDNIVKQFEAAMTADEKAKLYKAIGYQENAVQTILPEAYEAIKMNFKLGALEIGVRDEIIKMTKDSVDEIVAVQPILSLTLSLVTCCVVQRPAANAIKANIAMKELLVTGYKKDNFIPNIIESQVPDQYSLLDIFFETNPIDKKCDQRVKILARPLQIIYDSETIIQLIKVFTTPKTVNLSQLEGAAADRLANIKERSATGLQYVVDKHEKLEIDIRCMPNILIIPFGGMYISDYTSVIVVSLGQVCITSEPRSSDSKDVQAMHESGSRQDEILKAMLDQSYDKIKLSIDDIQILVAKPKEKWFEALTSGNRTEMHVLQPTSLILTADICVIDDDPRLPKTKIGILLPSIGINVTEERVLDALSLVTSIPLPEGDRIEPAPLIKASSIVASSVSIMRFLDSEKDKMAKKAAAKPELSSEIVQYTDLEVTFALNELAVTIYKAIEEKETPSEQYKTPTDEFSSDRYEDSQSSIVAPSEHEKILSFQVVQLEANMAQRTYEMVVTVKLGAINMNQYDKWEESEKVLTIIDTPRFTQDSESLLYISYINANKISPEFMTKYNSTEQLIQVNFSTLVLTLHQECLQKLLQIASGFQKRIDEINKTSEPKDRIASAADEGLLSVIKSNLETIEEEPGAVEKVTKSNRKGKVVDSIKVKILANLEQVAIQLTCRKRPIADLKVQNLNAGVVMKSSYTEVTLNLKDIIVTDLNPLSIHSNILSIIGENALRCQVVMFNLDETANYNSDDLKIDVTMGCVKIIFLNWFVTSVLTFLGNFQAAQQALAEAGAAAADAAKQNVVDAYAKATRMKFNIKIKAPLIVVPIDSLSLQAITLDLGFLSITNNCSEMVIPEDSHSPAVLDEIKLELKEMKLSKAHIVQTQNSQAMLTGSDSGSATDLTYGLKSNVNILDPISFNLVVLRNLSSGWYKEKPELDVSGRLKSIELNLLVEDYILLMSIVSKNLSEGQNEFPSAAPPPRPKPKEIEESPVEAIEVHHGPGDADEVKKIVKKTATPKPSSSESTASGDKKKIDVQLKFNFQIDGVVANLISADNEGLASFGLYFLSLKGKQMVDGTLTTSVVLVDIQLDDIRPSSQSQITKYLRRKESPANEKPELEPGTARSMLDVVANIKENDIFAEVRICGFDLIISIDFLKKIAEFFTIPEDPAKPEIETKAIETKAPGKPQAKKPVPASQPPSEDKRLNLILHLEEPDIILVESMNDINTSAIIFNSEVALKVRMVGDKQLINGEVKDLKMYMCSFQPERRESTKHYIIHPCTISLQGSTPEDRGLNISLKLSEIMINISPATIELINKAITTLTSADAKSIKEQENRPDYSDIWGVKAYQEENFWFMKIDEAIDVLELTESEPVEHKPETCIIEIPSITLVIETGVGYYAKPMLYVETRMNASVNDWSTQMYINGLLNVQMSYYNDALACWEPLIEQNERKLSNGMIEYGPWELNLDLRIESKKSEDPTVGTESMTKITVKSNDILELTLSKTCVELLQMLGQAFSQAFDSKGLVKPEVIAPYVIENDTGFEIGVDFTKGLFTLHECHMPNTRPSEDLNNSVVFQVPEIQRQVSPEDVKSCKISPGGRVYLKSRKEKTLVPVSSTASHLSVNLPENEQVLHVKIGDIDKEIILPVQKSDQRYFSLYRDVNKEPWGIISEVKSEFGTTKINIHGVVKVENHFTTTISIYRKRNDKYFLIGEVAAGQSFNIPLHAIYANMRELYFSLPGYKESVQGVDWKDCPTDLAYTKNLTCDPISTFEPLYITAVREKIEVYYEVTSKFTLLSACYTIHLRPPLYLRNSLPIDMLISVAGCSVSQDGVAKAVEVQEQSKSAIKEDFLDYGEKVVKPGDVLHLPTVRLTTKSGEAKSYIVARLVQYLEKDWSCTTEISENHEDFAVWRFTSYDSVDKMDMELGVRFENRHGSLMLTIYCPFWMVNKTGLMLSYRKSRKTEKNELSGGPSKSNDESINVLYHPPNYEGPILFSFREKVFFGKKRASIRVDNGEWSEKIPLDVAGSEGVVQCKANDMVYQIAVHNRLTQNSLTKQITFVPFYVVINKAYFPIEVQEEKRSADPWTKVEPNECVPLWPKTDTNHMLRAKTVDHQHVTRPFKYTEVQCTLLMMKNKYGGIDVDVQVTEGGIYITFSEYHPGDAPGLIINHTNKEISFWEKGNINKRLLQPYQKMLYTWADPAGDKVILWDNGKSQIENDLRRDGVDEFLVTENENDSAYWVSFLDGTQRVLLFTTQPSIANEAQSTSQLEKVTQEIEVSIHGIGLSIINNMKPVDILYLGIASSGVIWESRKKDKARFKQMKIAQTATMEAKYQEFLRDQEVGNNQNQYFLEGAKFEIDFKQRKLYKSTEREIRRTFYPGLWLQLKTSPYQTQVHAKINRIQIDNQLMDCIFPVVLAPVPPPKSVAATTALKPFVECSIVQRVIPHSTVKQFKYASVLIQEFHVKVDLLFITELSEMFSSEVSDEEAAKLFYEDVQHIVKPLSDLVATQTQQEQKNFYDNLHLGPLKIHVSFSMAGSETSALPGILSTILQGVGVTLTDVNDVVFRLAFFEREYQFFTQRQLTSEIVTHYAGQAVKQLYVLVLGLDVLGNPYGLVVGLTKGVEDLFYEPFQGAIQGPGEFAEGLVLGVKSLFGHTVGGAAGAVSKITGAMGKGLAALTFDKDYQRKRREALNKRPTNFQEGIARSGKGLVMGVVDGVTGVFTKPISGAKEQGVEGFFKGLGKGAVGLVARPTAGVVDFASGSFEAVKRATESTEEAQRLRPPRFLHADGVVRPYSHIESHGNKLLKEIEKGKYAQTDAFSHYEEVIENREIILLSNHRIIYGVKSDLFGNWTVQWTYRWNEIQVIRSTDRGVELSLEKEGKKILGLFSSSDGQKKIILIPQKARRDKLAAMMCDLKSADKN